MKLKNRIFNVSVLLLMGAGLLLMLYPAISDTWNRHHQSRAIAGYIEEVETMDEKDYAQMLKDARQYNEALLEKGKILQPGSEKEQQYRLLLSMTEDGIMGYISIPKIRCELPIYHGADAAVLEAGAGHLPWSSLPVGGSGTHTVLSGHRGLPGSKLFTDLDQMETGDTFSLKILNEVLTYEVDQILTVEPEELEALKIVEEKDYCTLVTCTPYAVNTHRLLVRGHRIENPEETMETMMTTEAAEPDLWVLLAIASGLIILGCIVIFKIRKHKSDKSKKEGENNDRGTI